LRGNLLKSYTRKVKEIYPKRDNKYSHSIGEPYKMEKNLIPIKIEMNLSNSP
jgi:hypothetical protein